MKLELSLELFNRISNMLRLRADELNARADSIERQQYASTHVPLKRKAKEAREAAEKASREYIEFTLAPKE